MYSINMKFNAFNLKPELIKTLEKLGYTEPTTIQTTVIPKALKGENIIVQSETGSGKTHSFLIPIINNLEFNSKLQTIIISPTRELSKQTFDFIKCFEADYPLLKVKLFVSGIDIKRSIESFENGAEIIVATPGRLKYLLENTKIDLMSVKTIVLDEADMLMDEDFFVDIDKIVTIVKKPQIMVFSATISKNVENFLTKYISSDYNITSETNNLSSSTVTHNFINTKHQSKYEIILRFIEQKNPFLLVLFANLKEDANKIYSFLRSNKLKVGLLTGDLQSRERKAVLKRIKNHDFQVVVCSDIAARGLDILDVSDVLSFDLPSNLEYYFHRAGRCGRMHKQGDSYVLYDSDHLKLITRLIEQGIVPNYLKYTDNTLVNDKSPFKTVVRRKKVDEVLEKNIQRIKHEAPKSDVKPGYKKKVKEQIQKEKKRRKREIIQKDIRRQREERYKNGK